MIRLRFAPSPTGYLHVGGVRTALFNWLFARKSGGKFILRIEDTDQERSTKASEQEIFDSLRWCGLLWDEGPDVGGDYGPYRQMERHEKGFYRDAVQVLLEKKRAYYSVAKASDPKTEVLRSDRFPEGYSEEEYLIAVKFAVPQGTTLFHDLLKGELRFENQTIDDFVILKSSGVPVYNFAVVVDDAMMRITHVIRGEDHISNTPRQIMLYQALGLELPVFMHLPLILGADKTPLSKRHGGTSVEFFRKEGYLSEGLMNYLALLGWNVKQEVFHPLRELEDFSLENISNKSVVFDYKKLEWINGKHVHGLPFATYYELFKEWIDRYRDTYPEFAELLSRFPQERIERILKVSQEKANTFVQLLPLLRPLLVSADELLFEEKWVDKYLKKPEAPALLERSEKRFSENSLDSYDEIKSVFDRLIEESGLSTNQIYQTLRGALTGSLVSLGLIETVDFLGRDEVVRRIRNALGRLRA